MGCQGLLQVLGWGPPKQTLNKDSDAGRSSGGEPRVTGKDMERLTGQGGEPAKPWFISGLQQWVPGRSPAGDPLRTSQRMPQHHPPGGCGGWTFTH